MKKLFLGMALLAAAGMLADSALAQGIGTAGVMRDEFALGLTPSIKSLGMGGAYLGLRGPRSMNPAALGGYERIEGTLTYGLYDHQDGPLGHRGRLDVVLPNPFPNLIPLEMLETAVARFMVDGVISDGNEPTRLGSTIDYDSTTLGMQSGIKVMDWLNIGFGAYPFESADVILEGPDYILDGEGFSQFFSQQIGFLVTPHERFSIGGEFVYIKDRMEAKFTHRAPTPVVNPESIAAMVPAPGDVTESGRAYYHIRYFAIGAAFEPIDGTLLALDYWYGEINGLNRWGFPYTDIDVSRWNFGAEQKLCDYFYVRAGSNNEGVTAGFTVRVNDDFDIDYAYAYGFLADKDAIFGRTDFHGISATYRF
ncbi:MAG: hypothetical protein AB1656_16010 [Candidatus Omnitrophota bacterium]